MKRTLLALTIAAPILAATVPQSHAAAIAGSLRPRLIGSAALNQRYASGVRVPAFNVPRLAKASNATMPDFLSAGTLSLGSSGSLTKTGAGTLLLNGTGSFDLANGTIEVNGFYVLEATLSLGELVIDAGRIVTISDSPLIVTGSTLTTSDLSLRLGGDVGNGVIVVNPASVVAPAVQPVPEPATSLLLATGLLAGGQMRRRRAA